MHSITNSTIRNTVIALTAVLVVAFAIAFVAPKAQAADLPGMEWFDTGYYDMGMPSFSNQGMEWFDTGYYDMASPIYDYASPSFFSPSSFLGGSGFSNPGMPIGGGGNTQSQNQSQSQSSSNNNTNVNNNIITIGGTVAQSNPICPSGTTGTYPNCVWPTPNCPVGTSGIYPNCVWPQPQQYDICPNLPGNQSVLPPGYTIQNGYCSQNYVQPYPTAQPYVTLSQVPYTGLEMGPVATALYWGFLVLWCLMAAYLIVVKKVQNKIAAWFTGSNAPSHTVHTSHAKVAHTAPKAAHAPKASGIDPFIQSQISR